MRLFLVGMPGCGKSSIGRQLAHALSLSFIDLDAEIERREQASIADFFSKKREHLFRQKEREVLVELCRSENRFVMATGGGTPCFFTNMEYINKQGKSLFLDVPVMELFRRLNQTSTIPIPLLPTGGESISLERIARLRMHRIRFYQQAHFIFSGHSINCEMILEKIKEESF